MSIGKVDASPEGGFPGGISPVENKSSPLVEISSVEESKHPKKAKQIHSISQLSSFMQKIYNFAKPLFILPALKKNKVSLKTDKENWMENQKWEGVIKKFESAVSWEIIEGIFMDSQDDPFDNSQYIQLKKDFKISKESAKKIEEGVVQKFKEYQTLPKKMKKNAKFSVKEELKAAFLKEAVPGPLLYEEVLISSSDDAQLDCMTLLYSDQMSVEPSDQKWIVCLNPNAGAYEENLRGLNLLKEDTGANILTGNYRGVGESRGEITKGADSLVDDGMAMVQHLIEKGVTPQNILIMGHSLGGGVAAQVGSRIKNTHVCIDRSFSSFAAAGEKLVKKYTKSNFLSRIAKSWLIKFNWEMDSQKALQSVKGKVLIFEHGKDEIILPGARLAEKLRGEKLPTEGSQWEEIPLTYQNANPHKMHSVTAFILEEEKSGNAAYTHLKRVLDINR